VLTCRACGAARPVAYKSTQAPAIRVALEMERDPGLEAPKAGDSVAFVYVAAPGRRPGGSGGSGGGGGCCERAMHPEIAARRGLSPDPLFYLEHQVKNVLEEVFRLVLPPAVKNVEQHLFGGLLRQHDERVNKQPRLTAYFDPRRPSSSSSSSSSS